MYRIRLICICIYLIGILTTACRPIYPNYQLNPVAELKGDYGASEASIQTVVDSYGISVDEILTFGPEPFPVNYILHQLNWEIASAHNPTVYRSKVEASISGYSGICKINDREVLYLFYGGPEKLKSVSKSFFFRKPGLLI